MTHFPVLGKEKLMNSKNSAGGDGNSFFNMNSRFKDGPVHK
jgi:hypothetical protein